jgi:hypothetical protein
VGARRCSGYASMLSSFGRVRCGHQGSTKLSHTRIDAGVLLGRVGDANSDADCSVGC